MIWARILWRATPGWAKAALAGALVVAVAFGWGWWQGGAHERQRAAQKAAEDYTEGRKDADDALADVPVDDSGLRDWLRDFAD